MVTPQNVVSANDIATTTTAAQPNNDNTSNSNNSNNMNNGTDLKIDNDTNNINNNDDASVCDDDVSIICSENRTTITSFQSQIENHKRKLEALSVRTLDEIAKKQARLERIQKEKNEMSRCLHCIKNSIDENDNDENDNDDNDATQVVVENNNNNNDNEVASENQQVTNSIPNSTFLNQVESSTTTYEMPATVMEEMKKLQQQIINKEIYPQLDAIVKSWIVMKFCESHPKPRPLLLIYDIHNDAYDRDVIVTAVTNILHELGFIQDSRIAYYEAHKHNIIKALTETTGQPVCMYQLINNFYSDVGYIQSVLQAAKEKKIFLITTQHRFNIQAVKDLTSNLYSLLLSFDVIDFGTVKQSELTKCFQLLMKSDGFVAQDGLLLFVENLFVGKKIQPLSISNNNEGNLETASRLWNLVKSAWSSRVFAPPKNGINNMIRIEDVRSASTRFVSWGG